MASTQPALDRLPTDVLEGVIALLPFRDICSLRLVSRTYAARSGQGGAFQKHFTAKTVEWTSTEQMQEFVHLTQPNSMGCFLQRLTIIGIAPAAGREHTSDKLLTKALTNLRLNSTHGCLQSVVLLVQCQDDNGNIVTCEKIRNWRQVWLTAARTFKIACRALAESALPIQNLDIFGSVSTCSLSCDRIGPILDSMDLSKPLENLKCLSLSLSHQAAEYPDGEALGSLAVGKRHAEDIARLLELCPQLENLDLHWYKLLSTNLNDAQTEERRFFSHIVQLKQLSQLRHCRLAGICTDEIALLAFLKKTTELSRFSMEEIHLDQGEFGPVFNYLTNYVRHLELLHLDDLWEGRLICFDSPGQPHFPWSAANGPNTLTRIGVDCRRAIKYRSSLGRVFGSPQAMQWRRRKYLLYGPPDLRMEAWIRIKE